jgi:hypothetical protein
MQLLADPGGPGPSDPDLDDFSDELDGDEDAAAPGASAPPSSRPGALHHRVHGAACTDHYHVIILQRGVVL